MKMKGIDYGELGVVFWVLMSFLTIPFILIFVVPILLIILANILMFFGLI